MKKIHHLRKYLHQNNDDFERRLEQLYNDNKSDKSEEYESKLFANDSDTILLIIFFIKIIFLNTYIKDNL